MRQAVAAGALALATLGAAPLPPAALVLNCHLSQTGDLSLGQFVRQLAIYPDRGIVSIADGVRGAPPRFIGNGRLIAFDANHVLFDFASTTSGGRTEIDRRTGRLNYDGGGTLVRGSCQPSLL